MVNNLRIRPAPPASSPACSPRTARSRKGRENFSAGSITSQGLRKTQALRVSLPPLHDRPNLGRQTGQEAGQRARPKRLRRPTMSNLNDKATQAASRYLEHRGYTVLETA